MAEKKTFYDVNIAGENRPPIARISPIDQSNGIGAMIKMNGRDSYDPEGLALTYFWEFLDVPKGSKVEKLGFTYLETDNSIISFQPDKIGVYKIGLIVNDGELDSQQAEALASIQLSLSPTCTDIVEDASFIWKHLSDFWGKVQGRERYNTVWSATIQAIADELLRAYQLDYSKSIKTIPDYLQRRWQFYSPRLDISNWDNAYVIIGNEGAGTEGKSGALGKSGKLVLLSDSTVLLINGVANPKHIGRVLKVLTSLSSNIGIYEIISLSGNGYKLSPVTLLPDYQGEEKFSGFCSTTIGAQTISIVGGGLLSLDPLPVVGDIVGISEGYFTITEVADTYVKIDKKLKIAISGDEVKISAAAFYEVLVEEDESTATFSVNLSDFDFEGLNTSELSGNIKITGPREISVPYRMYFEEAVGRLLTVKDGRHKGTYTVLATTPGGNGYVLAAKFVAPFSDEQFPASLSGRNSAAGRMLVADQRAATIANINTDNEYISPRSIAVCDKKALPSGYSGISWRVPSIFVAEENLEALGIRVGDVLTLEFFRTEYPDIVADIYFYVVGVDRNRLGFIFSKHEPVDGIVQDMDDIDIKDMADTLGINGVNVAGGLSYTGAASVLEKIISSGNFKNKYYNTELRQESDIVVSDTTFSFKFKEIIRNSRVAVAPDVVSIPCLKEYIKSPKVVESSDSVEIIVDGEPHEVSSVTKTLVENRDFVIESEQDIFGVDGSMVGGNSTITLPFAALISRDVQSGDILNILTGANLNSYQVAKVLSEEELEVIPAPEFDDTRAKYVLTRTNPGRFIRFIPGIFSADSLPPDRLWGEVTFLDNTQAIEDNFGWMVNVLKSDLDAIGSTADYRLAVAGVMYAWAMGPAVRNIEIGTQILFGLPFAETTGIIAEIDKSYQLDDISGEPILGRILLEETERGNPTGRIRAYFYPPAVTRTDTLTGVTYFVSDPYTTGIAINPDTSEEYREGDIVKQFSPLTKGARVQDYIDDPAWFLMGSYRSINEVKKVHTFRVRTNSDLVDTLAADFVYKFLFSIKPVWTNFLISIIKYLQDEIETEEECKLKGTLLLYDTPGYSIEPCVRLDNTNDSSQLNFQLPEFETGMGNTRTLQEGHSLTTTNGTAIVQVEGNLITPPPYSPVDEPLTRRWDLLVIRDGVNKGKYAIDAILSDSSLSLGMGPGDFWGVHPEHFVSVSNQTYQILREHTAPILFGPNFDTIAGSLLTDIDATWQVDGAVPGDTLVVMDGVNWGRWRIAKFLPPVPPAEIITELEIDGTFIAPQAGGSYEIQRDALHKNPIDSFMNVTLTALIEWVDMNVANLYNSQIQVGDYFYAHNKRFKIIDIERSHLGPLAGHVAVSPIPVANWNEPFVEIIRDHQGVHFNTVEWNIPEDELRMTLITLGGKFYPTALTMAGSDIVDFSANIFNDLQTVAGDVLILYPPTADEGEHVIAEIIAPWKLRLTRALTATEWTLTFGLKVTV